MSTPMPKPAHKPAEAHPFPRQCLVLDGDEVVLVRRGEVGTFPSPFQPAPGTDPAAWVDSMNARRGITPQVAERMRLSAQDGSW